jgi:hypothetical protein
MEYKHRPPGSLPPCRFIKLVSHAHVSVRAVKLEVNGRLQPVHRSGREKRRDIAMAMYQASDFDALDAFAIKDHVVADREAPDRWVQLGPLATYLRRVGQELSLLVELIDQTVGGVGVVLRYENLDVGEVSLSES